MREIKFRAWDKKNNKFLSPCNVHISGNNELYWSVGFKESLMDSEQFDVVWFTGLKDNNGKEIYEGDIVRFIELERKEGSTMKQALGKDWVKAYNEQIHLGEIKWNEKEARFYPAGKGFYDEMGRLFSWKELKVIGNIYENPKLLEVDEA